MKGMRKMPWCSSLAESAEFATEVSLPSALVPPQVAAGSENEMNDLGYNETHIRIGRFFCHNNIDFSAAESWSFRELISDRFDNAKVSEVSSAENALVSAAGSVNEENDLGCKMNQRKIGRIFYENHIDFSAVESWSFRELLSERFGSAQVESKMPNRQDLKCWILQDEVMDMQNYVKSIRDSWVTTGCTILVDSWIDDNGRELVNFITDSLAGPFYLKTVDISNIVDNPNALVGLVEQVIESVGVDNVVQVIGTPSTGWVGEAMKDFVKKHSIFLSVSASQCLELVLENIKEILHVMITLNKAKRLTKFIQGNPAVLNIFRVYSRGCDLIKSATIRSITPYLTLVNIMLQKENLCNMFSGREWKNSTWASKKEGMVLSRTIRDPSFWKGVETIFKASIPLIRLLCLLRSREEPRVGYIYESMDQVKEMIQENLGNDKSLYMPFWNAVDDVWNTCLHSPLHAAGYYLNPAIFYSTSFHLDEEVATGLKDCITGAVKEPEVRVKISSQLDLYRLRKGTFAKRSAFEQRTNLSPVEWWLRYGTKYPELQRFAIRIVSQTCEGASRYRLKRSLAEKLVIEGRDPLEQKYLDDLAFVHYNLQLRNSKFTMKGNIVSKEVDRNDDWAIYKSPESESQNVTGVKRHRSLAILGQYAGKLMRSSVK